MRALSVTAADFPCRHEHFRGVGSRQVRPKRARTPCGTNRSDHEQYVENAGLSWIGDGCHWKLLLERRPNGHGGNWRQHSYVADAPREYLREVRSRRERRLGKADLG